MPSPVPRAELKYIFQKLFWSAEEIWITPLTPGYSGAGVFMVIPDHCLTLARPVIVKIGLKEKIQVEEKNYNEFVKWFIGSMRSTVLMASAYSDSLGGIVYSLIGNPMDGGIISFENYYNNNGIEKVEAGVKKLFNDTCMSWYQRIAIRLDDIVEVYKKELSIDLDNISDYYQDLFPVFSANHRITYPGITHNFIDPVRWISTHSLRFAVPTSSCITHGDFNKNNIIFDNGGDPWLIDFMLTKRSCALRDFIRLETTIKFEILDGNINPLSYFNFEKALAENDTPPSIFSNVTTEQDKLEKAFRTIRIIRDLAVAHVPAAANDMNQYYIGLLMQTLKFLTWDDYNNKDFILISSGLLCEKLERTGLFRIIN